MSRSASNHWNSIRLARLVLPAHIIDWVRAEREKCFKGYRIPIGVILSRIGRDHIRTHHSVAPKKTLIGRVDAAGNCIYQSEAALDFLGWPMDKARADWGEAIHPEDRPRVIQIVNKSLKTQRNFNFTYRVKGASGEYCLVATFLVRCNHPDGSFDGFLGYTSEIPYAAQHSIRREGRS